mmetsp:Transcript_87661/g.263572  ORF Transcript_87661/g.263572 Transcript_87661/m.263572 type:complete len:172 (-) Transcript_87661:466-981(-)
MAAPKVARQMAAHDPPCQPGETAPASWELAPELQSSREPLARMDAALDAPDEWTKESVLKWGHAHYGKNAWSRQAWSAWADEQLAVHHEEQRDGQGLPAVHDPGEENPYGASHGRPLRRARSPPRASSTSTRARSTTRPRCQTRSASCARTPRWCVCARRRSPKSPSVSTT